MQIFSWPKKLFLELFLNSFLEEKDRWILWATVIFGGGIIFYFSYDANYPYTFPLLLLCSSAIISIIFRKELFFVIVISVTFFSGGFLWAKFYSQIIAYTPQITHPLYINALGKIDSITPFENSLTNQTSHHLLLKNVQLYKIDYSKETIQKEKSKTKKKKKKKIKKPKIVKENSKEKIKKPRKKRRTKAQMLIDSGVETPEKEISKPKIHKKKSKKDSKTVLKNYLNIDEFQEIDRDLPWLMKSYSENEWYKNKYTNPPEKINITINKADNLHPGDWITTRVFLEPFKKPTILNSYDFSRDAYFKSIGAYGRATSSIVVISKAKINNFNEFINNLRQKITEKILNNLNYERASIAIALTVGYQDYITKNLMSDIRNSGLAHLLSISGLHLTLAFGIFFLLLRFILSCSNYLALNYDIKKISALFAIIAGFIYLMLAGSPVPAIRSFIMVGLIFLAVLLDQNPNPYRSIAFAAFIILFLSPDSILSISFQLSFAAILALITLYDFISKSSFTASDKPFYLKFICYFLGIIFSSLAAEIATTPFSIYHFNNYIQYGMIANLIAIPIASFLIMPFIFLSLFLMPLGLEKLAFYPMGYSIDLIIKIANYISHLPFSYHNIKMISSTSFGLIIIGGLWFCLWQKKWRIIGIIPIIFGAYLAYKTPLPDLLIDGERKYFAIYNPKEDELIFSKKTRESRQIKEWQKKMGVSNYRNISELTPEELNDKRISCNKEYCQLNLYDHNILILTARNKINFICKNNSSILINLTKYKLPNCSGDRIVIDNYDLFKKGGHFLYLKENQLKIKTIN